MAIQNEQRIKVTNPEDENDWYFYRYTSETIDEDKIDPEHPTWTHEHHCVENTYDDQV